MTHEEVLEEAKRRGFESATKGDPKSANPFSGECNSYWLEGWKEGFGNQPTYTVAPARHIYRSGEEYISIRRECITNVEANELTHFICRLLNEHEEKAS